MYKLYYSRIVLFEFDYWITSCKDGLISIGLNQSRDKFLEDLGKSFKGAKLIEDPLANEDTSNQLSEYALGKRKQFSIPLKLMGTEFEKSVWLELIKIPYGNVVSYKDIAIRINNEKAYRAVGMANNKNRIPIVIPCHRVIGSNKKLVGYAGGLEIKRQLLRVEGIKCFGDSVIL